MTMIGAAYLRCSDPRQDKSIEQQRIEIERRAKADGVVIPAENWFIDEGFTGRAARKRRAYQAMIRCVEAQKERRRGRQRRLNQREPIERLYVWAFSRLARNMTDCLRALAVLEEADIEVVSLTGLKPPTVFRIFTNLEANRYIKVCKLKRELPEKKGRKPVYYCIEPGAHYAIGLDFWSKSASVIIRTMDIGGDKFLSQPLVPAEMRSFLGWRAIRFCLARPDIFKTQLRAILRASADGRIKIMFPMISGVEELREAKKLLEICKKELKKEGKSYDPHISIGTMIEVPSAALTADALAKESDFFSIGTNDLIQYSLAVDRGNEKVAYLYEPGHPGVLRLIKKVIEDAHNNGIWVGMCGEMSGETLFSFLLLGLGLDEFSMPPPRVPRIKELIRSVSYKDAKAIAEKSLDFETATEVEKYLRDSLKKLLGSDYERIVLF